MCVSLLLMLFLMLSMLVLGFFVIIVLLVDCSWLLRYWLLRMLGKLINGEYNYVLVVL